jgi:plasmid stabilization system protein ParE
MDQLIPILLVIAAALAAAILFTRRRAATRSPSDSTRSPSGAGWRRLDPDDVLATLAPFELYTDEARRVDAAVGGDTRTGTVTARRTRHPRGRGSRPARTSSRRSDRTGSRVPVIALEPRSVRTVRVVRGAQEVEVADPRLARGWRVLSDDAPSAAALLDDPAVRQRLVDVLHRPVPWIVGCDCGPAPSPCT